MSQEAATGRKYEGRCMFCDSTLAKSGMTRHLKSCKQRTAPSVRWRGRRPRRGKTFHLVVEGRYAPDFWMHLEVPARATLEDLDKFLRETWLECCGHLSAFTIEGKRYSAQPGDGFFLIDDFDDEEDTRVPLGEVLNLGTRFYHEYDFGSTTELALRVVSEGEAEVVGKSVMLLARNELRVVTCDSSDTTATQIYTECIWEDGGLLCPDCASEHECDEGMFLPLVNSPRAGVCGYEGPLDVGGHHGRPEHERRLSDSVDAL